MGFLEAGASVTILDRSMEAVEATVKELSSFDTDVHGMSVDVSSAAAVSDAMDELFEGASGTAGKPAADILCNVAGITRDGWLTRMSEENWDAVIDVNLKGTFLTTQAFARKRMALNEAALPSEGGVVKPAPASVINIGSIVGKIGNMGQANYSASKAGVVGFTKTGERVRVSEASPKHPPPQGACPLVGSPSPPMPPSASLQTLPSGGTFSREGASSAQHPGKLHLTRLHRHTHERRGAREGGWVGPWVGGLGLRPQAHECTRSARQPLPSSPCFDRDGPSTTQPPVHLLRPSPVIRVWFQGNQ